MDADSLTLEQICKDLGISETELNLCMPQTPVQFQRTSCKRRSCDLPKENADQVKEGDRQTDHRMNKRAKVAKWTVSEAAVARPTGKLKRVFKSDDVLNCRRRDVDERTRRDLDESSYK